MENFFSQIRGLGGSDTHPDRLQVLQRAKLQLLTKSAELIVPQTNPNVIIQDDAVFITAGVADGNEDLLPEVMMDSEFDEEETL